ncbi:Uncharacterised protein [Mycobacteroides abscessus subsp. abscessus]|nr:Uncharacterised protein [Mycobacteroides abscessus subsp. abscessus]
MEACSWVFSWPGFQLLHSTDLSGTSTIFPARSGNV